MSKQVLYEGERSIIHEPTGVLLQPGVNEIADASDAAAIIKDGTAKPVEKSKPEPKGKGRDAGRGEDDPEGEDDSGDNGGEAA